MLGLRRNTPASWVEIALDDLDSFLQDHAANERKVSQSALALVAQHPTRTELCQALTAVAQEELEHFRCVHELLIARGQHLGFEQPDPYMTRLRAALRRTNVDHYLLDRLLLFGIIEARGCERFALLADALQQKDPGSDLALFYTDLVRSESRHHALYHGLARHYFESSDLKQRLDELLELEAATLAALPLRPALH